MILDEIKANLTTKKELKADLELLSAKLCDIESKVEDTKTIKYKLSLNDSPLEGREYSIVRWSKGQGKSIGREMGVKELRALQSLLNEVFAEPLEEHTEWVPKVGDVVRVLTRNEMLDNPNVGEGTHGNLRAGEGTSFTNDMDKFSGNNYRIFELRDNDSVIQLEGLTWVFHTWMLELVEGAK